MKETLNESIEEAKREYPTKAVIWKKYNPKTQPINYKRLLNLYNRDYGILLNIVKTKVNNNKGIMYYELPDDISYKPDTDTELRLYYFNIVTIRTLIDYLKSIEKIQDTQGLEIEAVYGNTILPLVKIDTKLISNPVIELPIIQQQKIQTKMPIFGLTANKVSKKDYLSFYIHILSIIEKMEYSIIQLRTKKDTQYVVDMKGYASFDYFKSKYMD
jgi:hypothetical protein